MVIATLDLNRSALALLAAGLVAAGAVTPAAADRYGPRGGGEYVVAESRFGNGTVVGPVRRVRVGLQVRMPGGNWLHCARSCSETLRVNTVDFWQNHQGAGESGAIDQEDGLLSHWLRWPRRY